MQPFHALAEEVIASTNLRFPCRLPQITAFTALLHPSAAPCRNVVVHGSRATGKSAITRATVAAIAGQVQHHESQQQWRHAVIKSSECISGRQLFEQTLHSVADAVAWDSSIPRCESLAQLLVELERLLGWWAKQTSERSRIVLVFDDIDHQRDAPPTLLPALARFSHIIPWLSIVFITTCPRPNFLRLPGVPHIHFPAYTKEEILHIASNHRPQPEIPPDKDTGVWETFSTAVWDTQAKYCARDLPSFRALCARLWPSFVAPILAGSISATAHSSLLISARSTFQDEQSVLPNLLLRRDPPLTTEPRTASAPAALSHEHALQLPRLSRILLVAAYLASHNPPRTDQIYFIREAQRRRRKQGGGTALSGGGRRVGTGRSRRVSRKLLGPQAFGLERLLAIFHAIRGDADGGGGGKGFRTGSGGGLATSRVVAGSADLLSAVASLTSLRFLVRAGDGLGLGLDGGRWRVGVAWELVRGVGRSVGMEVDDLVHE